MLSRLRWQRRAAPGAPTPDAALANATGVGGGADQNHFSAYDAKGQTQRRSGLVNTARSGILCKAEKRVAISVNRT